MHKSGQTPDVLVAVTVSPAVYSQLSKKKKKRKKKKKPVSPKNVCGNNRKHY